MNVTGIIVEYNPFHKGHLYHINITKKITNSSHIIAVMSGNFVQRGTPAMIDKWNRAKLALLNGVDLVIELPLIYSLSSAEFFSYGAVSLLESLGIVNNICFGSECGDTKLLNEIAKILCDEPYKYKELLKKELQLGLAYPSARSKALFNYIVASEQDILSLSNIEEILSSPNNILGIEYCKSLIRLNSSIKPYSMHREGSSYNSTSFQGELSSASSIRKYIKEYKDVHGIENFVPDNTYKLINSLSKNNYNFSSEDLMLPFLKYKCSVDKEKILNLPDVSEGIHNRIFKALETAESYDQLINSVKTKRFTYSRISRILCQFFVGFENFDTINLRNMKCPYARILGFNEKGIELLRQMKTKSSIPAFTKLPKDLDDVFALDVQGTRLYSLLNNNLNPNADYLITPIKL